MDGKRVEREGKKTKGEGGKVGGKGERKKETWKGGRKEER